MVHRQRFKRHTHRSGGFASPFVSTKQPVIEEVLQTLRWVDCKATPYQYNGFDFFFMSRPTINSLSSSSVMVDLGSGDGAFVLEAARRVGCRCIGIELDEALVKEARRSAEWRGVADLVAFHAMDMFAVFNDLDLECQADVLYHYQLPAALHQLEPHILRWLTVAGGSRSRTECCITWPLSDALADRLDPPDPAVHARRGYYVYRN